MSRSAGALLLLAVALLGCPKRHTFPQLVTLGGEQTTPLVFKDVRVFTATSREALEHQDVVVQRDRIVSIAPTGGALPAIAEVIDGAGRTLLPGFVDFHTHMTGSAAPPWHVTWPDPDANGRAWLFSGVTTAHDVGGNIEKLRELSQRADWVGPTLYYSGPAITKKGSYPASMIRAQFSWPASSLAAKQFALEIETADDAKAAVDALVDAGAHHLKVAIAQVPPGSPVYDEALLRAVVDAGHARGKQVVAHIDTAEHALLALSCGVDALVHTVHVGVVDDAQLQALAEAKKPVAPTLVVFDRLEAASQFRYQPTAMEQKVVPGELLKQYAPEVVRGQKLADGLMEHIHQVEATHEQRLAAVKRLYDAGVPLFVGSDGSGAPACWPGATYLDEMRLLAEAGVPNAEILLGATSRPAKFIEPNGDFGTVEPGKRADLVLVEGNPLDDISATSKIRLVVQRGRRVQRE